MSAYSSFAWPKAMPASPYQLGGTFGDGSVDPQNLLGSYSGTAASTSTAAAETPSAGGFLSGLWDSMFDKKVGDTTTQGWLSPALGVAQGLGNAYMGMKQFGLAEDALKEQQRQFNMNYQAQRNMTNSMLEDRQRSRVAANPGAYQSVGDYMQKYGV